jgi:uncharacterized membrane protein
MMPRTINAYPWVPWGAYVLVNMTRAASTHPISWRSTLVRLRTAISYYVG